MAHNLCRLRDADWNDALDMASEHGESVAFTCAYAGNLLDLSALIRLLEASTKLSSVDLLEELSLLLDNTPEIFEDTEKKQEILAESTHNMQVLIDAEIRPQFNLLAEQIQTMMETRVDTARVERLEDEVSVHKMIIRQINEDLQQLKKAQ